MADGQNRFVDPVDGMAHIEQLASVVGRVQRKKEQSRSPREKRRRKAGIEETLQEEKEQLENESSEKDDHIDFHA